MGVFALQKLHRPACGGAPCCSAIHGAPFGALPSMADSIIGVFALQKLHRPASIACVEFRGSSDHAPMACSAYHLK
jgi:hypothetical protein